ncbi:MAG: phosphoglucosamine mutase [Bacteroidales bacterium]|nr:phosphoglucosamine mutase [Bacteroidales bacterium]MDG2080371.1 phosphoglucosamine mutase [Bacteroidales bacterium]
MTLIKSISGIRGTIGNKQGDNLTPIDIVKFTAAFGEFMKLKQPGKALTFVVGRDARISGKMVENIVVSTLSGMGINVINTGLSTTPTVEMAVMNMNADGGIIITASHNPKQWNALKLLNQKGEFISAMDGEEVLKLSENPEICFSEVDDLGTITEDSNTINQHISDIIGLKLVDKSITKAHGFNIVIDAVNSTGGLAIPPLLKELGINNITELYCEPTGHFPHNPEPLAENLTEICNVVKNEKNAIGIVVDPDVDRLALVMENGELFGEEYTLVAVADYVLRETPGNTVSNLSSTKALRDVTEKVGCVYNASAVGEVNVVTKMKETNAVIGGEGNGGVIYPELHYGRDSLVGIALILTYLAKRNISLIDLRKEYTDYRVSKNKIELHKSMDVESIYSKVKSYFNEFTILTIDGVKVEFPDGWVHLRTSNTEPIMRIYAESTSDKKAQDYADNVINLINS